MLLLHVVLAGARAQLEIPKCPPAPYGWQLVLAGAWVRMGRGSGALVLLPMDLSTWLLGFSHTLEGVSQEGAFQQQCKFLKAQP